MSSDLLLSRYDHDLDISAGSAVVTHATEPWTVAQRVKIALLIRKGEFFLDTEAGVPYLTDFLVYRHEKAYIDTYMKMYIENVEDVNSITDYESTVSTDTRIMEIRVDMDTEVGSVRLDNGEVVV